MLLISKLPLFMVFVIGRVVTTSLATQDMPTAGLSPSDSQIGANALIVEPLAGVTAIHLPDYSGWTHMYYQNIMGDLIQHTVQGGAFTTGSSVNLDVFVLANSTRRGTPIAATIRLVQVPPELGPNLAPQFHMYYITQNYTLGELRYNVTVGWIPGARGVCPFCRDIPCPMCIDSAGFKVVEGSQVLYAIHDKDDQNLLRVGFESTGVPGTISEAVTTNLGRTWQIAPVPDIGS